MPRARPNESGGPAWVQRPPSDRLPAPVPYIPPPPGPAAGWYRDPGGRHQYRFWNGWGWTPGVANGPYVRQDFSAPPVAPWVTGGPDARATLPRSSAAYAFGGIMASVLLSFLGALVARLMLPHSRLLLLVLGQAGLWSGLVGAVWLASTRFGTGNIWRDFGVSVEAIDLARGAVISIGARFAGFILLIPLALIDRRLIGSDVAPLHGAQQDPAVLIAVVLMVIVGAPFIEELFFRGLLLRSLVPILRPGGAIVVQGLVFGAVHLRPSYGLGNVSIFVVIGAFGVIQGIVAERYRRLGPGIVAHGFFNLVALILALALRQLA